MSEYQPLNPEVADQPEDQDDLYVERPDSMSMIESELQNIDDQIREFDIDSMKEIVDNQLRSYVEVDFARQRADRLKQYIQKVQDALAKIDGESEAIRQRISHAAGILALDEARFNELHNQEPVLRDAINSQSYKTDEESVAQVAQLNEELNALLKEKNKVDSDKGRQRRIIVASEKELASHDEANLIPKAQYHKLLSTYQAELATLVTRVSILKQELGRAATALIAISSANDQIAELPAFTHIPLPPEEGQVIDQDPGQFELKPVYSGTAPENMFTETVRPSDSLDEPISPADFMEYGGESISLSFVPTKKAPEYKPSVINYEDLAHKLRERKPSVNVKPKPRIPPTPKGLFKRPSSTNSTNKR